MTCRRCGDQYNGAFVSFDWGYTSPDYVDGKRAFGLCESCSEYIWKEIHE